MMTWDEYIEWIFDYIKTNHPNIIGILRNGNIEEIEYENSCDTI